MNYIRIISIILVSIFILQPVYAKNPSDFIQEITDNASNILSSDLSKIEKQNKLKDIAKDAVDINVPKNQLNYRNEVLSTFGKMLSFENYIIANSTFSWWAARISSTENSKVLYPNPFFKDESFDAFYDNWTPIER